VQLSAGERLKRGGIHRVWHAHQRRHRPLDLAPVKVGRRVAVTKLGGPAQRGGGGIGRGGEGCGALTGGRVGGGGGGLSGGVEPERR
jgi:hypothetical protein